MRFGLQPAQDDVERLQGSLKIEHTLATVGAEKLWRLMHSEPFVPALGALTGNQAMQMVRAGLKAVYCSGWQVRVLLLLFQRAVFAVSLAYAVDRGGTLWKAAALHLKRAACWGSYCTRA